MTFSSWKERSPYGAAGQPSPSLHLIPHSEKPASVGSKAVRPNPPPDSLPGFHALHNRKKETAMMKERRRHEAAARAPRMSIVYRAVDQLKPDPANARRHSKKQIRQIAESIQTFGFNVPILTDHEGKVVAGHGRLLACRLLGITEVPTLCLDHLTAAQARAFMIADNRLTEIATWDDRLLAEQLKELSLSGLDFNIEVTGFEMGEIDLRIASLDDPIEPTR
jgi:hypothetical protein